ncbi:hypothetical protein P7C70_g3880, partial [Phenoliferia sp. Uapishka_3]
MNHVSAYSLLEEVRFTFRGAMIRASMSPPGVPVFGLFFAQQNGEPLSALSRASTSLATHPTMASPHQASSVQANHFPRTSAPAQSSPVDRCWPRRLTTSNANISSLEPSVFLTPEQATRDTTLPPLYYPLAHYLRPEERDALERNHPLLWDRATGSVARLPAAPHVERNSLPRFYIPLVVPPSSSIGPVFSDDSERCLHEALESQLPNTSSENLIAEIRFAAEDLIYAWRDDAPARIRCFGAMVFRNARWLARRQEVEYRQQHELAVEREARRRNEIRQEEEERRWQSENAEVMDELVGRVEQRKRNAIALAYRMLVNEDDLAREERRAEEAEAEAGEDVGAQVDRSDPRFEGPRSSPGSEGRGAEIHEGRSHSSYRRQASLCRTERGADGDERHGLSYLNPVVVGR